MSMLASSRSVLRLSRASSSCPACQTQFVRHSSKLVELELIRDVPKLGLAGQRVVVAPGQARHLYPAQAVYIVAGSAVSPLRDIVAKQKLRELRLSGFEAARVKAARKAEEEAAALAASLSNAPSVDAQALAVEAERTLFLSLSLVSPLVFRRRPINSLPGQATKEIFGSVQASDVVEALRESGVVIDESMGAFEEATGVEARRVKALGDYTFTVSLKLIDEKVELPVQVIKE